MTTFLFIALMAAYVIGLNVWFYRSRRGMTAAQRADEDEDLSRS